MHTSLCEVYKFTAAIKLKPGAHWCGRSHAVVTTTVVVTVVARRRNKTSFNSSNMAQSRLRDNPIYVRSTTAAEPSQLDHCNSLHHHHNHHQNHHHISSSAHSYEKLDHLVINPHTSSSTNPPYNLLTVTTPPAAVTSPDVVNTMGYLVASPTSCDQFARPIIIWAPRSRAANNMAELNVVTDQHGRQCCCNSTSGLSSTATSCGGYMECDTRTRNMHVFGGEESRDRHVTGGAESSCLPSRDHNTNHRSSRTNTGEQWHTHHHQRLNDCNVSAL